MKSINRVTFLGHIVADPEVKNTKNKKHVSSFAIATNNEWFDAEGELNTEGMANLNVILNPDILVPGKKFSLEIPQDWKTRTVSDWVYNQVGVLVQTSMTMEEWMSKYNVEEGSDKWLSKVPMDMILDGINIGPGVHDVAWWNSRNVADFKDATINGEKLSPEQAIQQQRKVAQQGQDLTMNIRKAVYAGNNEMVISVLGINKMTNWNSKLSRWFLLCAIHAPAADGSNGSRPTLRRQQGELLVSN